MTGKNPSERVTMTMPGVHGNGKQRSPFLGALSLVMGLLACAGVTAIWLVSTPSFDMSDWLRSLSGWMFPNGAMGAIGFGVAARMQRSGVGLSTAGFILAGLSLVEFVGMIGASLLTPITSRRGATPANPVVVLEENPGGMR